jgi:hypothetical protein
MKGLISAAVALEEFLAKFDGLISTRCALQARDGEAVAGLNKAGPAEWNLASLHRLPELCCSALWKLQVVIITPLG